MLAFRFLPSSLLVFLCISMPLRSEDLRIVFLAGTPSHGYGAHEHLAGSRILAECIQNANSSITCEVYPGGWPEDESVLDGADAIVMYCDGGERHPAVKHLKELGKYMDRGVGFVCLHYGVEVPKDNGGPEFLKWLGGYFETNWSVNPHWNANYTAFPKHPVTRGVQPFDANDEWYFHMRFVPDMQGVTPVLSAIAPLDTMRRPDGPHSGNPAVREEVAKGVPQHMAWVYERPSGGRSFGFTGGHYHWNWGRKDIVRLVSNAIVWTAGGEIPEGGLPVNQPGIEKLEVGQDEEIPPKFDAEKTKEEFKLSLAPAQKPSAALLVDAPRNSRAQGSRSETRPQAKLLFESEVISATRVASHAVDAAVDVTDVKKLYLVCTDAGDGFSCDWADWLNPKILNQDGKELDLTSLDWFQAESQWGQVRKGRNAGGGELRVRGVAYDHGIGTHANSVIGFELPAGSKKLTVTCGLDNGGTDQNNGAATSVRFRIYAESVPANISTLDGGTGNASDAGHAPQDAVAGLTVHPGLEATLTASEPQLLSLTNLDIDHRGRIWVCEVVNYRRHNGERPEGDRILILEDTDHDGKADVSKVYYQGRDIDSAMGICVLGNKVIVSASPNVWMFTDEDGDDKPDRKELFFSNTGQPQHDHSAHSFSFGPDGKLYWNFGNTGKSVHDAEGNLVVDLAGNNVEDNGRPYWGGMPFRCNLDGSEFEVLAHNFRNNYEIAVDSFGGLWQSDNDDDGNRATRINFVMEFGNYGYLDQQTGAGWRESRTNLEDSIPAQHWHLNDPGVVPTMLITGAGSPTGITVYEGDLLPAVFQNQVLHCDAGPNVVRAYPTTPYGAGYTATVENLVLGDKDQWFRPADICVAPDGSVFVTDWYDPGVGGHAMGDTERGRLFRIAPPGAKYLVPTFDFDSAEGVVAALHNPNQSVRYLAWQRLASIGSAAQLALEAMATDENPRMRTRALWAIGKQLGHAQLAVASALSDADENVRAMGVRLARQVKMAPQQYFLKVLDDPSPQVRRELAIALRFEKSADMPALWAALAKQHDGADRWYLEALGIGAELRWQECLDAYLKAIGSDLNLPGTRDIVWRARTPQAAQLIVKLLTRSDLEHSQALRLLRALDFQQPKDREDALKQVVEQIQRQPPTQESDWLTTEALLLQKDRQATLPETWLAAVERTRARTSSREEQFRILSGLGGENTEARLLTLLTHADLDSTSVRACEALLQLGAVDQLQRLLRSEDPQQAIRVAIALAQSAPRLATELLEKTVNDSLVPVDARVEAAKGLAAAGDRGARSVLVAAPLVSC